MADGEITRIDVRPDWRAVDTIGVTVMLQPLRPTRQTSGRAVQMASDPARIVRDGVPYPRPVTRWTWYADHRVRWLLAALNPAAGHPVRGRAGRGHWTHRARRGGPAADVLRPDRAVAAPEARR